MCILEKSSASNLESSSSSQEEGDRAAGAVEASENAFVPEYDEDGNMVQTQTSTGTWQISYNGENRPIRFENTATQTVVECIYDSQGRRFEKKVTVAGTLTLRERYLYRGYLQIAAFDVASSPSGESTGEAESTLSTQLSHALKHVIFWDPTEPVATRPLAINIIDDGIYFPTTDLTKNVCELVDAYGDIAATYDYAPFGSVSAGTPSGTTVPANPLQWSSEVYDSELDLVYYNYRHYSPSLSRFLSRDPIQEQGGLNLYVFVGNNPSVVDNLGESQHGCNNVTHTEFQNLSDEEVNKRYEELSKKSQKTNADKEMLRKLKAEQKGRQLRHSRLKLQGFKCRGGAGSPGLMVSQLVCALIAMYVERELEESEKTEGESGEKEMALSASCVRGVDGLWRCVCPSGTTAYGAGDLSCKTFTSRPLIMCIKHNVDIPVQSLIGLVESNNAQVVKNENCCNEQ